MLHTSLIPSGKRFGISMPSYFEHASGFLLYRNQCTIVLTKDTPIVDALFHLLADVNAASIYKISLSRPLKTSVFLHDHMHF